MLRYAKKIMWLLIAIAVGSALWALDVEITYERNVRHIPTNFYHWHRAAPHRWRA